MSWKEREGIEGERAMYGDDEGFVGLQRCTESARGVSERVRSEV